MPALLTAEVAVALMAEKSEVEYEKVHCRPDGEVVADARESVRLVAAPGRAEPEEIARVTSGVLANED